MNSARLHLGLFAGLVVLMGCGGLEAQPAADEATGTTESAVYVTPDNLSGLLGSYSRASWPPAPAEELTTLSLYGTETPDRVEGSYLRTVSRVCPYYGCNSETGSYVALASNPAIGSVIVFNDPLGTTTRDSYSLISIQRSAFTGKITNIVLVKNAQGAQQFTLNRTSP
ncbi:MAG TPA: hypothetical protein VE153_26525 [Myxococcus sp.]|jgi:hypothetical protein|nr:hypothetical protein [Myxococcus sp.]